MTKYNDLKNIVIGKVVELKEYNISKIQSGQLTLELKKTVLETSGNNFEKIFFTFKFKIPEIIREYLKNF